MALKAKLKPCRLNLWLYRGYKSLDDTYRKYGTNRWFKVQRGMFNNYYPCDFNNGNSFLESYLIIKEIKNEEV